MTTFKEVIKDREWNKFQKHLELEEVSRENSHPKRVHTVILSDRTLKKWALSSFAFQSF